MKRFLKNTILLFLIYLGLALVISLFIPYYWGNPWYSIKIKHLENKPDSDYNTYFFGSSRVHDQLDPSLFDRSMKGQAQEDIRSFNLGIQGSFPPQTYFQFENFLDSKLSVGVKYCFLEIREVSSIRAAPPGQAYWLGAKELAFAFRVVLSTPMTTRNYKFRQCIRYLITYIKNTLLIGYVDALLSSRVSYSEEPLGPEKNGFLSVEYQYATTTNEVVKKAIAKRRELLENEPQAIEQRRKKYLKAYSTGSHTYYNKAHQERVLQLIERAKDKGIHLILLYISSGPKQDPERAINLCRSLPKSHIIELADPAKYPELYYFENAFDRGHLNTKGSRIFTRYLAQEFKEIKEAN